MTTRVPFAEGGGAIRGCLDLVSGRFPRFVFGGRPNADLLPVFHFHEVTRDDLEPKLRYLAENGYRTATADDIAAYARRERRFDGPYVGLCFDDAWSSLWSVAAPLLKEYGLTAITYAIPARIVDAPGCRSTGDPGTQEMEASPFVTWPELRALHASGVVDVQSHTESHSMVFCSSEIVDFVTPAYASTPLLNRPQLTPRPNLRFVTAGDLGAPLYAARSRMSDGPRVGVPTDVHERCVDFVRGEGGPSFFGRSDWRDQLQRVAEPANHSPVESAAEQQRAIEDELERSRAVLNEGLRTQSVNHICLPWGVSGRVTSAALGRVGYRSAFANRLRGVHAVRPGDDPLWLKRLPNKYILHLPGRGRRLWL